MRTEGVYGRLFSSGAVLTALETDGDRVAGRLDERYRPASPGNAENLEEVPLTDFYRQHLDHLTGDLRTVHTGLASAEDEYQRKLMLIEELVHGREKVGDSLSGVFFKVRHSLETLYSETERKGQRWRRGFVLANVSGATPRTPRRFLEQVVQTEKFLRKPAVEPPSLELKGVKIDFGELADDLKPLRQEYGALLDAIDRTRKEGKNAKVVMEQAIEEFNRVFGWVTRAFESLFHLAGLHEMAEQIRPSVRRKGRRAVDEEASPAEKSEPSEEAPSTEASSSKKSPAESESASVKSESASTTAASLPSES